MIKNILIVGEKKPSFRDFAFADLVIKEVGGKVIVLKDRFGIVDPSILSKEIFELG